MIPNLYELNNRASNIEDKVYEKINKSIIITGDSTLLSQYLLNRYWKNRKDIEDLNNTINQFLCV